MKREKESWRAILRYAVPGATRARVRRAYAEYRKAHGVPDRCDNPECVFHRQPLIWNGSALPIIVDHVDGVKYDNRPHRLRYLCPNCDAQAPTRGGKNKGRVEASSGGFAVNRPDGKRAYTLPAETGRYHTRWVAEPRRELPHNSTQLNPIRQHSTLGNRSPVAFERAGALAGDVAVAQLTV